MLLSMAKVQELRINFILVGGEVALWFMHLVRMHFKVEDNVSGALGEDSLTPCGNNSWCQTNNFFTVCPIF